MKTNNFQEFPGITSLDFLGRLFRGYLGGTREVLWGPCRGGIRDLGELGGEVQGGFEA